jgi:hypothetical protein
MSLIQDYICRRGCGIGRDMLRQVCVGCLGVSTQLLVLVQGWIHDLLAVPQPMATLAQSGRFDHTSQTRTDHYSTIVTLLKMVA